MSDDPTYRVRRRAHSRFETLRGLRYHLWCWGDASLVTPQRPALVMLHGWMDVGASFQFTVDALAEHEGFERHVVAPDWRGFGRTRCPGRDAYWFADYLGDLDALLRARGAEQVDLLGHSMGGNIAMLYAGLRPQRIRRLVNLEGFGLPRLRPEDAPGRTRQWLDQLHEPARLRDYESLAAVADRLRQTNPRLDPAKAAWLAPHWAARGPNGRWLLRADPAHKRWSPIVQGVDEVVATWREIKAPLLWVEGRQTDVERWWGKRYPREEFELRLAQVADVRRACLDEAGHMLHHDQPQALAAKLAGFLA